MATLTVTATSIGAYSAKVTAMTVVGLDLYHVLHGLGATPNEVYITLRSSSASIPMSLVLSSYDATMCYFRGESYSTAVAGTVDVFIRRTHSLFL